MMRVAELRSSDVRPLSSSHFIFVAHQNMMTLLSLLWPLRYRLY
jgi:hypothetical protein